MKWMLFFLTTIAFAQEEMKTVALDLDRYVGKWYEIASIPQRFQRGCVGTTATYKKRKDGDVDILNECRMKTLQGPWKTARGKAWVVDSKEPGKLEVRFFWPFKGKYWVLEVGSQYEYAVVGHPDRKYLWILSRTPLLEEGVYQAILKRMQQVGYDLSQVQKTTQE